MQTVLRLLLAMSAMAAGPLAADDDPTLERNDGVRTDPSFRTRIVENIEDNPQIGDVYAVYDWERERFRIEEEGEAIPVVLLQGRYGFTRSGAQVLTRFKVDRTLSRVDQQWHEGDEASEWYFVGDQAVGCRRGEVYYTFFPGGEVPDAILPISCIEEAWVSFQGPEVLGLQARAQKDAAWAAAAEGTVRWERDAIIQDSEFETAMDDEGTHPFYVREKTLYVPNTRLVAGRETWVVIRDSDGTEHEYLWSRMSVRRWQDEFPREIEFESFQPLEMYAANLLIPGETTVQEATDRFRDRRTVYRLRELRHPEPGDRISVADVESKIAYLVPSRDAEPVERLGVADADGERPSLYVWNELGGVWLSAD